MQIPQQRPGPTPEFWLGIINGFLIYFALFMIIVLIRWAVM